MFQLNKSFNFLVTDNISVRTHLLYAENFIVLIFAPSMWFLLGITKTC